RGAGGGRRVAPPCCGDRVASDPRVSERALPPYFVASIDNEVRRRYRRNVRCPDNEGGSPCADLRSCCSVSSPFPRQPAPGRGLPTGRSCVPSPSIRRILTRAVSTGGSTSASPRGHPCERRPTGR